MSLVYNIIYINKFINKNIKILLTKMVVIMNKNVLINTTLLFSAFLGLFSSSSIAMPCGNVPVYCLINTYGKFSDKVSYDIVKEEIACMPTTYKLGNAAPICKTKPFNEMFYFLKCFGRDPVHVVGIVSYRGGDPVNPLNKNDKRMHGTFYQYVYDVENRVSPDEHVNLTKIYHSDRAHSCDITW